MLLSARACLVFGVLLFAASIGEGQDNGKHPFAAMLLSPAQAHVATHELYQRAANIPNASGIWFTLISLDPKVYLAKAKNLRDDPSVLFVRRYSILMAIDLFEDVKSEKVSRKERVAFVDGFLAQQDMADLAIERYRKWKHWEPTQRILGMYDKKPFDKSYMRKAILRYALQAPGPEAAAFVAKLRKMDREWVEETEELLKLEEEPSPKK